MKKNELESSVERYLNKRVEELGGKSIKLDSKTGLPDRLIILPHGEVIFVETKRPVGGVVAPLQYVWQEDLRRLGMQAVICRSREEVDGLLNSVYM